MTNFAACLTKTIINMYSSEDFERFYIRYKAEGLPRKLSIQEFCIRNKVPWNLFNKWYRDTRHRIVPVEVTDKPSTAAEEARAAIPVQEPIHKDTTTTVTSNGDQEPRIMVDIRMTTGLHIQQRNLNYHTLKRLVENLEVLC